MRICILQVLHEPFDKRVFHKEAKSLAKAGHEILSITPSEHPVEPVDGIRFEVIPPAHSLKGRLRSVLRLIAKGRRAQADAYLAVEPESWVAALVLKMLTGRKVVFDVHEHIPSSFANFFPSLLRPAIERVTAFMMRLFARFTDHIILTKMSLDEPFEGLSVPRTLVLNTNHLQAPCAGIPDDLKQAYGARPTIIHQGIFGDVRGSYQLLDAMEIVAREIPDVKCILLGKYMYGDEAQFRDAIERRGLAPFIDMIAEVPFDRVPPYIAVSRVGLILFQPIGLGHTLGMPHKMFDYMREGVPLIAPSFAVEIRRIVEESHSGLLVEVTDPKDIARAILHLLRNEDEARQLGQNGRAMVEAKYHWGYDEQRLLDVFASLR